MIENFHHGTMTAWDVAMGFQKMIDDNKKLIIDGTSKIKTDKNPKGAGPKEYNIQNHNPKAKQAHEQYLHY